MKGKEWINESMEEKIISKNDDRKCNVWKDYEWIMNK